MIERSHIEPAVCVPVTGVVVVPRIVGVVAIAWVLIVLQPLTHLWHKLGPHAELARASTGIGDGKNIQWMVYVRRRFRPQRYTSTGMLLWVRTLTVWLPKTTADIPLRPCDAIMIKSHPLFWAVSMMPW